MLCEVAELLLGAALTTMFAMVLCPLPALFELLELLEQLESIPTQASIKTVHAALARARGFLRSLMSNSAGSRAKASMSPGAAPAIPSLRIAAVADWELLTTSVAVAICPAERLTVLGVNRMLTPCGKPLAVRETLPLNALLAISVSVVVAICPALRESVGAALVIVKAGETPVTVTLTGTPWELGLKFVSPEYAALTGSVPTGKDVTDSDATPPANIPVPSVVLPEKNVTVPVGVGLEDMLGAIVAVSTTAPP
jgi:hypothetical protein